MIFVKVIIHAQNIDLTPSIEAVIGKKLATIEKLFDTQDEQLAEARVEVGRPSRHHHKGFVYRAEINLKIGSNLFRAEVEHADLRIAIDFARDEIERQIKKFKSKTRKAARQPKRV